jgi:hypothetical protein
VDLSTFIIAVFCEVDDWFMEQEKLRERGPEPTLSDSEVLTMEIVGEFLGIDAEKALYAYFKRLADSPGPTGAVFCPKRALSATTR